MKQYISKFTNKTPEVENLINITIYIFDCFGIPLNQTERRLERMAIVFLATGDVKNISNLKFIKDLNSNYSLTTRQIIEYVNEYFQEKISSGSYDDIRRKDLEPLISAEVVLPAKPNSATNDSTRGYSINPVYAELIKQFGSNDWGKLVSEKLKNISPLKEILKRERQINKVEVTLSSSLKLFLSEGKHNDLQKAIIEEFLPRYGHEAEVFYFGDTSNKYLYLEKERLEKLKFFEISDKKLPDVIAYSKKKNWLYLIEAVYSSGPIDEYRLLQLKELTKECTADIIYVTAFLSKKKFREFMTEIAWETEVWIADNPDHLIHFNGDKFLGPYKKNT